MGLIVTPGGVTMLATMAGLLARLGGEAPGATARGRLRACCGTIAGETTFLPPAADPAGTQQVWSLTQFYSVDFSQSGIGVGKVRFLQTHNQGLRQLLLTVSWDLRA